MSAGVVLRKALAEELSRLLVLCGELISNCEPGDFDEDWERFESFPSP